MACPTICIGVVQEEPMTSQQLTMSNILATLGDVAEEYGVSVEELKSKRRLPELVRARVAVAKELYRAGLTAREIGKVLNRRTWTVAWYLRRS